MRSKTTHAVWSGVGEFAARESESAKCKPTGKNDWRSSTPQFSPENFGSPGFFVPRPTVSEKRVMSVEDQRVGHAGLSRIWR